MGKNRNGEDDSSRVPDGELNSHPGLHMESVVVTQALNSDV